MHTEYQATNDAHRISSNYQCTQNMKQLTMHTEYQATNNIQNIKKVKIKTEYQATMHTEYQATNNAHRISSNYQCIQNIKQLTIHRISRK